MRQVPDATIPAFVIHWRSPETAADAARALGASPRLAVTVIDNASEAFERDRLRLLLPAGAALATLETNVGFAGAANVAIRAAADRQAPRLVLAAHDVVIAPDALERLLAAAETAPHGVLGPALERGGRRDEDPIADVDWVPGALMVIRTDCATAVGGFDETLFAYCEDVDFCWRARARGWRVGVVVDAPAAERGQRLDDRRRQYLTSRNWVRIVRTRRGSAASLVTAGRYYGFSVRAALGAAAPWRDRRRRRLSWDYARAQAAGATAGLLGRTGPPPR